MRRSRVFPASAAYSQGYRQQQPLEGYYTSTDWMNWVESGIEFFGSCEAQGGQLLGRALALGRRTNAQQTELEERDYPQLHEDFFESLLKEQLVNVDQQQQQQTLPIIEQAPSLDESLDDSLVSNNSEITWESLSSSGSSKNKKGRIPYFHKLSPRRKRVAPIEAYNRQYNPVYLEEQRNSTLISLEDLHEKSTKEPEFYLDPHVQLQKDKGKGLPMGSAIGAEGRYLTLEKLRDKMKLVIQVSGQDRRAASSIKRKVAKLSLSSAPFVETRSMIELRLGFLSLQYGLLLRWDTRTGKVVFCCLRKNCQDSFYTSLRDDLLQENDIIATTKKDLEAPPFVVSSLGKDHAIYQRISGLEVVCVDAPFRVEQPDAFAPSSMMLEIHQISGISSKHKKWSISVTFCGHSEVASLYYNRDDKIHTTKRPPMIWDIYKEEDCELQIRLFEQHKRKNTYSRLAASMTLPLASLIAQPSTKSTKSWNLQIPFYKGSLTLAINHRSEYNQWLYKELDVRRLEEINHLEEQQRALPIESEEKANSCSDLGYFLLCCGYYDNNSSKDRHSSGVYYQ